MPQGEGCGRSLRDVRRLSEREVSRSSLDSDWLIEEPVRIHRSGADADFIMQMRSGRAAGHPNFTYRIALTDLLSGHNHYSGKVPIVGLVAVSVIDDHDPAITGKSCAETSCHYHAVCRDTYASADWSGDVESGMISALLRERV